MVGADVFEFPDPHPVDEDPELNIGDEIVDSWLEEYTNG